MFSPFRDETASDPARGVFFPRRDLFLRGLDDLHMPHTTPEGAYYVLLDISEFGYASDLEFCEWMVREVGVAAVPGSSFFREPVNNLIRLHFAREKDTIDEVFARLEKLSSLLP